ncbi:hypothetical protein [Bacteroides thetaiotaomicron]|uniref:hypothetical protein n=1 Tax=Bacteroides thetaiotaomicron TaxID=818 RepID=UPI0021643CB4|nr:hypothetical protein [Bacteroides thetaiotaomicron]UVQ25945.1 hypothetical protein NXW82_19020 [Bacteroides thetaiotaomicron]
MKVIFDTNAAREYITKVPHTDIENYARTNAEKMKKGNINLLVNPIVIVELMYHLLDKNDKDYYISYNTIKALVLTMEYQYKNEKLPMMAVAECIIARDLFNLQIEEREKMYSNLMSGASYIVDKGIDNMGDFISANGTVIKEYVDSVESSFVEQAKIISKIPSVHFSENFLAMYIIRTTYNLLMDEGKMDSQIKMFLQNILNPNSSTASTILQQITNDAQKIATKYPSFIALFKQVIIKVKGGMSDEKIKNYIWDILLMFNITNLTIDKEPVIFVTSDKAMLEAANISQMNLFIMTFKELKDKYLQ